MGRPKGSTNKKYKNKKGTIPMFRTEEELQSAIDKYFEEAVPKRCIDDNGETYVIFNAPTITGLAYALGFESRQSMYDYEQRESTSYTIKRARLRIANQYEQNLSNPRVRPAGAIFALKNIDSWTDKKEVTVDNDAQLKDFAQIVKELKD